MSEGDQAGGPEVEATGETVGEAKWTALRELERRFPGLDKDRVRFAVVSEGERGLLGVGHVPARVVAALPAPPRSAPPPVPVEVEPDSPAARLREFLERICAALGAPAEIRIADRESEGELEATLSGSELGVVIGKRGQTIDAIQYLANAVVGRGDEVRRHVVVDAAGYRARRRASLERAAERAAERTLEHGVPVALDPMTAAERKIVHLHLQDRDGVETESDGLEPNRHVVIRPSAGPDH